MNFAEKFGEWRVAQPRIKRWSFFPQERCSVSH